MFEIRMEIERMGGLGTPTRTMEIRSIIGTREGAHAELDRLLDAMEVKTREGDRA